MHSVSENTKTLHLPASLGNESDLLYRNIYGPSSTSQHPCRSTAGSISIPVRVIPSRSSKEGLCEQRVCSISGTARGAGRTSGWSMVAHGPCLAVSYRVRGSRCSDRWMRTGTKGGSRGRPGKASSPSPTWTWSKGHWWKTGWITLTCLTPPQAAVPPQAHRYLPSHHWFSQSVWQPLGAEGIASWGWLFSRWLRTVLSRGDVDALGPVFMHTNGTFTPLVGEKGELKETALRIRWREGEKSEPLSAGPELCQEYPVQQAGCLHCSYVPWPLVPSLVKVGCRR